MKGVHYLLRGPRDYYTPMYVSKSQQTMKLTIEPYFCQNQNDDGQCYNDLTSQVTIYNKRRD